MKRVLIIGGYGNTGRSLAKLLLKHAPDIWITLAGRNPHKARRYAGFLNEECGTQRVCSVFLDAKDAQSLMQAFAEADFVINASSAVYATELIVHALLETGKDALDTQLPSPEKQAVLERYAPEFRRASLSYVTDGGFHPGVPAALVRFAAMEFDRLEKANVFSAMRINWKALDFSPETMDEFLHEFRNYDGSYFKNGEWKQPKTYEAVSFEFAPPFGKEYCTPMHLPEMEILPNEIPGLMETGFYVSGFNALTDYVLMPVLYLGARWFEGRKLRPFSRLLKWGLGFTRPPYGVQLVAECAGQVNGEKARRSIRLFHKDAYLLTAAPVASCVLQILYGRVRRPGLWRQAGIVEPARFIADLIHMGVKVSEESPKTANTGAGIFSEAL